MLPEYRVAVCYGGYEESMVDCSVSRSGEKRRGKWLVSRRERVSSSGKVEENASKDSVGDWQA